MNHNEVDADVLEGQISDIQKTRSYLRERFLRIISELNGKQCHVKMYENTEVSCKTRAFEPNFETVVVENLQTPRPVPLQKAILRTSDIISMHYEL